MHRAPPPAGAAAFAGAFDGISFVALYGLVRFLSAYEGNLIRLRRDSDNAEMDFGYVEATGLLDAAAIATWLGGANGYVVTWYDQSGNGRNATQATAGSQPAFDAAGLGSMPVVRFDGSNDYLGNASFAVSNVASVLFVSKKANSATDKIIWSLSDSAGTTNRFRSAYVNGGNASSHGVRLPENAGVTITSTGHTTIANVFSVVRASTTSHAAYLNGGTPETSGATTTTFTSERLVLGAQWAGSIQIPLDGDIAAWGCVVGAISTANHNTIGAELASLYDLDWNTVS